MKTEELTPAELDRMADAYEAMTEAYAGRPEQAYCEERAELCRAKARDIRMARRAS